MTATTRGSGTGYGRTVPMQRAAHDVDTTPVQVQRPRLVGVDATRGVALLGMMAVHALISFDEAAPELWQRHLVLVQAIPGGVIPVTCMRMLRRMVPPERLGAAMGLYGLGIIVAPAAPVPARPHAGSHPGQHSLALIPQALVLAVLLPLTGVLYDRIGSRWLAVLGLLVCGGGLMRSGKPTPGSGPAVAH